MKQILTFEEISDLDEELCKHCMCTDYGLEMNAPKISEHSFGCEGAYCKDAYEKYLEDCEEDGD